MDEISQYKDTVFEKIKHINEYGAEFWSARELQLVLGYAKWDKFLNVIENAKIACISSGLDEDDHFLQVGKMVEIGSRTQREILDFQLSRYACYLIVQNGDPRKETIALGQTYFAIQTRKQETLEDISEIDEDTKRVRLRQDLKEHNKKLADAAKNAGVESGMDYGIFQNYGYRGLYGGLTAKQIHARKGLKPSQDILDNMGSTELAANWFRATQTEEKLRRENTQGKEAANQVHMEVGEKVRQTIKDLGGTMPEDLPTPDKSIKEIEAEKKLGSGNKPE